METMTDKQHAVSCFAAALQLLLVILLSIKTLRIQTLHALGNILLSAPVGSPSFDFGSSLWLILVFFVFWVFF
jgi:hypothetical protein